MRITRTLSIGLLLVAATAQAAVESPIRKTFSVAPGGTLFVETDIGDVRINSGGSGVTVDVKRRAKSEEAMQDFDVTFEQTGNDVTVRAKYQRPSSKWFNWSNEIDAQFTISVPTNYNVQIKTSGGDLRIANLNGDVRARTSGGGIEMGNITGTVEARTSGGSVTLDSASGRADLRTSGGSIEVGRVTGDLYAHTSGGGITIEDAGGVIDAQTSGGSIRARLSAQPRGDSKLSTSGGNIVISVPSNASVDLDAKTSGGDVETDVPVTILGMKSESELQGKINGGGPRLTLRSSGGGIRLTRS